MRGAESGFTIIELLIALGIVAILSVVVITTINPNQLLKQSRDSGRISDLATLKHALSIYTAAVNDSLGTASTVYVSIPDSSVSCANLGLPALPSGWSYHCAPQASYRKVDGTGWLPLNFSQISFGSPIGILPADPTNTTSTGLYYTYAAGTNGKFQFAALLESNKYQTKESTDGGSDPASYEAGSDFTIAPFMHGLAGYWKLDETSGTTAMDNSGWGYNAGMFSSGTPALLTTGTGWNGNNVAVCDGVDDMIRVVGTATSSFNNYPGARTVMAWVKRTTGVHPVQQAFGGAIVSNLTFWGNAMTAHTYQDGPVQASCSYASVWSDSVWKHMAVIQNRAPSSQGYLKTYVNGSEACSTGNLSFANANLGFYDFSFCARQSGNTNLGNSFFTGFLGEIRIYNRALSAAEIQAIYNATK